MHQRPAASPRVHATLAVALAGALAAGAAPAHAQHAVPVAFAASTSPDTAPAAGPDTVRRRRHAIEYSDAYATRLEIHRIGSYVILPLFAGEYLLGNQLMSTTSTPSSWVKPTHKAVALTIGGVFAVNTVTGLWNAWDSRHDPAGRGRRLLHEGLMLASEAGFVYTGTLAHDAHRTAEGQRRHRNAALASIGVSTVGTAMMWIWNR